jgi:hypothetical protein
MQRFRLALVGLALAAGLAFATTTTTSTSTTTSTTLDTDSAALVWTVTGSISGFPGISASEVFTCTGTGSCQAQIGGLLMTFTGDTSSKGKITFEAKNVCGNGTCTALVASNDTATVSPAATLTGCTYALTYNFTAYEPGTCNCFGGSPPAFHLTASATATGAC